MSGGPVILTLDIGSSSVRARLYGRNLDSVRTGKDAIRPYRWSHSAGGMEYEAENLFAHVVEVVDVAVAAADRAGREVAAVAIASYWHGLVGLDADGSPATPIYGWGDGRGAEIAARLARRFAGSRYHGRTGCFLHPMYPAVRIAWLKATSPVDAGRVRTWASPADYIERRLFGTRRTSISMASATGMLDFSACQWDEIGLRVAEVDAGDLPALTGMEPVAGLDGEWAKRWPSLRDVPWLPAVGDGACANLGSGAIGRNRPCLTVGTSAAVRVIWPDAGSVAVPPELWCYRLDADIAVAGGALSNGGNVLAYLQAIFPDLDFAEISRAIIEGDPDDHGLTIVPSLVGERGGSWGAEREAAIVGVTPRTAPADIARAWLEAIAQRTAEIVWRIESTFGPAVELTSTGGALDALPGWKQSFADAAGRRIVTPAEPEATSRGAAVLAARELGWIASFEEGAAAADRVTEPVGGRRDRHLDASGRRRRLSLALADAFSDDRSAATR